MLLHLPSPLSTPLVLLPPFSSSSYPPLPLPTPYYLFPPLTTSFHPSITGMMHAPYRATSVGGSIFNGLTLNKYVINSQSIVFHISSCLSVCMFIYISVNVFIFCLALSVYFPFLSICFPAFLFSHHPPSLSLTLPPLPSSYPPSLLPSLSLTLSVSLSSCMQERRWTAA